MALTKIAQFWGRRPTIPTANLDNALRYDIDTDVHKLHIDDLLKNLNVDPKRGLTTTRARELLRENGPNALTPPKKSPEILKLIRCCCGGFSLLIWVGSLLCFASYFLEYSTQGEASQDHLWLGLVLVVLIMVTGMFSFYQQSKSSKIMESFQQMLPQRTKVIRDSEKKELHVTELVLGDIVLVETGDRVPADIRILECQGLKVDNASITGESMPLLRSIQISEGNVLEAKNMAFFSTNAVEGTGKGVVVACGDQTVMGRVAKLTSRLSARPTPLSREIHTFMRYIFCWAIFLGVSFFVTSIAMGYDWVDSVVFLIGIIVANVPEGLLATVTVSLTLTAKRMASKNCLVKNLEAIETLGCTSVICSDKTGTLTQNKMTVRHMWYDGQLREIMSSDTWRKYSSSRGFQNIARIASLCNRAEWALHSSQASLHPPPLHKRKVLGDASDTALLKCMEILVKGGAESFRSQHSKVFEIPFNSTDKFQANIHLRNESYLVSFKGAPERILERCSTIAYGDETIELTQEMRNAYTDSCYDLANNGERVLGFADLELSSKQFPKNIIFKADPPNFPMENLRLVGLVSMMDPPRPSVPDAVYKCRCAGIKVIMVTGDHPDTAKAIAKYVGIITEDLVHNDNDMDRRSIVVTGDELRDFRANTLDDLIRGYPEIVFARTSPVQKLQIVESCQRLHMVTAVTGDGVNDSPALKKADIGIAMGIAGEFGHNKTELKIVYSDTRGQTSVLRTASLEAAVFTRAVYVKSELGLSYQTMFFFTSALQNPRSDVSRQVADLILLDDNFASIVTGVEEGRRIFDNLKSSIAYTLASNVPEITPFLAFIALGIPLPVGIICILCIDLGTDMWPAISLAYEKSESDIMSRRPRIPYSDHLVSRKLVFMAYGQIGIIEAAAGFFTYLVIMAEHGFLPDRLLGLRSYWDSKAVNDLKDSYNQEWTYEQRKMLEFTCHTAFFVSIVIVQCADVIICKTRRISIFHQGMNNWVLNFGLFFEILTACIVCYAPWMDIVLKTYPLQWEWWLPGFPFAFYMLLFDELRKLWIRKNPGGWWDRETSY